MALRTVLRSYCYSTGK